MGREGGRDKGTAGARREKQEREEGASSPFCSESGTPPLPGNCGAELRQNANIPHDIFLLYFVNSRLQFPLLFLIFPRKSEP